MSWKAAGSTSHRYGSCALWVLDHDLVGSAARHLAERVGCHFRSGEATLVLDLRQVRLVDSAGADALTGLHRDHAGLRVVGRPSGWSGLPLAVRRSLIDLDADLRLETALASLAPSAGTPERRRCPRIPLHLPVELYVGDKRGSAALRDISRGGARISPAPGWGLDALRDGAEFHLLVLTADPLVREIAPGSVRGQIAMTLACSEVAPAIGARFSGSPPPV